MPTQQPRRDITGLAGVRNSRQRNDDVDLGVVEGLRRNQRGGSDISGARRNLSPLSGDEDHQESERQAPRHDDVTNRSLVTQQRARAQKRGEDDRRDRLAGMHREHTHQRQSTDDGR